MEKINDNKNIEEIKYVIKEIISELKGNVLCSNNYLTKILRFEEETHNIKYNLEWIKKWIEQSLRIIDILEKDYGVWMIDLYIDNFKTK